MDKKLVKNVLHLQDSILRKIYNDEFIEGISVRERVMQSMSHGFRTERFVIQMSDERYFKFVAVSYLSDELIFTKPFEVFQTDEQVTRTTYSPWIDVEEDEV